LASDVFVFASASEGLPLAVLEAMSTALPVVAITLPSLREVIAPGRNGYLINPHDTDGFRGAVEELCYDDQLRARMGMESRRIVASQFNVRSTQHTIEDVYEQVVQQPQLSPRTIPL
jgi:glycosyltransferase involved in cell wall biosynthesis